MPWLATVGPINPKAAFILCLFFLVLIGFITKSVILPAIFAAMLGSVLLALMVVFKVIDLFRR